MSEGLKPWAWLESHSGWLLGAGLTMVGVLNWVKWRQDRALALQLRDRKLASVELSATPQVSVLVAAWNEAANIQRHIESFERLRYPHRELILCAGGTDETYKIASSHAGPNVMVLEQRPGEGKQRALRRCLEYATGQVIFLTDADCQLDDDCFERTLAPVIAGSEAVATGSRRPLDDQLANPFVQYQWLYHAYCAERAPAYVVGLEGRNTALHLDAVRMVGGFEGRVPIGTDYYLARKLLARGYRIRHVPASQIRTHHASSFGEYWRQQSRWQRNVVLHGASFGVWTELRGSLQRSMVGLVMLCAPFLVLIGVPLVFPLWAPLVTYGLLARLRYTVSTELAQGSWLGPRVRLDGLLLYMFVDFVAWAIAAGDLVWGRRRWRW